jgi:phosphohistidine swiveling domain-containing protein
MSFCVRLGPTVPPGKIGGKARSLLRLAEAGLPVPPAVAVTTDLFAALRAGAPPLPTALADPGALGALDTAARALAATPSPPGFDEALAAVVASLDGRPEARFAVRSSSAMEDREDALGAGLFLSRLDVPAAEVPAALRQVLASAVAPGVVAYLTRLGLPVDGIGFAALVHPFVRGDAAGTAALDSSHGAPVIDAHVGDPTAARPRLQEALGRLTVAHGPVEVEWVATGAAVTFLQMRPYRRPMRRAPTPGQPLGWRWDAAHNPLPLSPAQAGLVELVDRSCETGIRQQTVGGYLFYTHGARAKVIRESTRSPSRALLALEVLANLRLRSPFESLEKTLDSFLAIYEPLFGIVQPVARAAREALADFLRRHGLDPAALLPTLLAGVASSAQERAELARGFARAADVTAAAAARDAYLDRFGNEAPTWDVAAPTWREEPAPLERRLRRLGRDAARAPDPARDAAVVRAALPASERETWDHLLADARDGVVAAENDDAIYARAQARVRHALLAEGRHLVDAQLLTDPTDVFWLPLDLVRGLARGAIRTTREEAARLVAEARRADAAARAAPPSLAGTSSATETTGTTGILRGRPGAEGVVVGRVRIWRGDGAIDDPVAMPEVIVARTILPTELPLVDAAALVVETGGPLDHVAAQARERGIPAVVGAAGACAAFADGDQVIVDGGAGLVARID